MWIRDYVAVEANSPEEALQKCKDGEYEVEESIPLYDCVEEPGDKEDILEIYDEKHNSLYKL